MALVEFSQIPFYRFSELFRLAFATINMFGIFCLRRCFLKFLKLLYLVPLSPTSPSSFCRSRALGMIRTINLVKLLFDLAFLLCSKFTYYVDEEQYTHIFYFNIVMLLMCQMG